MQPEEKIPTLKNTNNPSTGSNEVKQMRNSEVDHQPQDDASLLKGKVVFTLDLDEIEPKERKNGSFFRRKVFKKKKFTKFANM